MSDTEQNIKDCLEQLALQVVMLEADDLPGWGTFLQQLGQLQGLMSSEASAWLRIIPEHLEQVGQQIILSEVKSIQTAQELIVQGLNLLMEWSRNDEYHPEATAVQAYQSLAQQLALSETLAPESPPPPDTEEPNSASSLDLSMDQELVQNFIAETTEHLNTIETEIVYLEQEPGDQERLNAIFRPFHSIKGVAGFLNFHQIHALAHELETLLDEARSGRLVISETIIYFILNAVDVLKEMLADVQVTLEAAQPVRVFDLTPYKQGIKNFLAAAGPAASPPREPSPRPLGEILLNKGVVDAQTIENALDRQRELREASNLGKILIEEGKVKPQQIAQALMQQMQEPAPGREAQVTAAIKVDVHKLDYLVDMMGELVIVQTQVQQHPQVRALQDQSLVRNFSQMSRITSELQRISMSLRMVPISQTFQKMVRLVRDLARKSNKRVELHLEGEDTEIDRNMVEAIYDPLVHMVRNAIDHGLETMELRQSQGKTEKGSLWLRAYHQGGNVVIEIEDDGQGLNRQRILAKARQQGLVAEAESLSPTQIDHLIFRPGFSTADQITEVSGRGVGMDVVKQVIEDLRGKIEIASQPGQGSKFIIRLPLTLAIIEGIIVRVGEERYIIPAVAVQQTLRPKPEDYFTVKGQGELIRVRDNHLPLVRLHQVFQVNSQYHNPTEALVLVVENEEEQKCLMVDDIVGKQEVVIKSLGQVFNQVKGVSSGTILGDGRVGLILDLGGLFSLGNGFGHQLAQSN
ncbi:MAG: chemotaxis protein CheA [Desulfobacca sp.]|nr:chemotaxis protein CheA [Desulfobacca sp.]